MPIYNYNGETYDIPLSLSTKFESDMPDASVQMYDRSGNSYSIPLQLQGAFKRDHEGWSYDAPQSKPNNESDGAPKKQKVSVAPKPMDERGYVFNESELMGESTENKDNTPARTLKGIVDAQKPKTMADVDWSKVNANIDFSTEKNPYPQYTGEDVAKNFEKQRIAQQNQEEDSKVDKQYTPKEDNTAMDVYDNYMNRFALTKEGSALQKELADIEGEVQNKYLEEFKTSDAYKNIMALYDGSEDSKERVSTLLNETFVKEYGERINNDIAPYRKAYIDEMQTRYGDRFKESIKAVARKENARTVNTLYQEVRDLQKEIGGHSYVSSPSTHAPIRVSGGTDAEALLQAEKLLRDSRNVIEEATKHKDSGFISGVGRGVRDNLSPEDFTFGISDLADEKRLNNILGRYEKGEKVSDAEMKLLEASAANMVTHAYYDMMLSSGYKAGQVTAESMPFMLEFVANPIAGSGKALAKGLLKVALKKFGSKAINAGTKFGARLLGDALAAGGMTLTSGLAGVEAEATRRMNEGYDYGMRDGKLYVERKPDAISWGEARGKAFAQRAIENQSEMVFNAFSGVGKVLGGKGSILSKLSESKGGKFIKDAFNNKYIKEIAESTQFHGLPVEYMEEVYNNGANVLLGEMSVEDFADVDKNVETFLGLAPTSVVFGLLGLGGMAIDKVSNRRELNRIYNSLPDDLREQYNRVMQSKGYNAESTKEFVKGVITNPRATEEEKAAAIRLGYCTVADMTYEDAEQAEQSGDVSVTPGNNNEDDVTEGTGVGPSLVEGGRAVGRELYAEHDVTKMRRAYLRALYSMNRLRSVAGDDVVTALDRAESDAEFEAIISSLPEEYKRYASDYVAQRLAMDGLDEALDARYSEDAALAESVVSSVFDGGKRMVPIARLDDNSGIVVLNGIEADGSILTADGSVMGVRVPLVDGMPDWKSFDASAVRSYRIKDEDVISTATPNTVTEVLLADKLADEASISTASPISVGAQFPVLLDGELRDVRVVGQNGQNWLVEVTGEKGFEAVSPRELELWKHQAEMLPIEQEYQEIDNKAINNDKGIGEESRVERNEADDAVGVSPVGEGAHEVGVQERPEVGFVDASSGGRARPSNSGREGSVQGAVAEVPGDGVKASALSRLAVYPDGHAKAGRPDYESSRVEDVRDYLLESLGEEKALKTVDNTISANESRLKEKQDYADRFVVEMENSALEVDDMLRAQEQLKAVESEVAALQKSVDYWKEVRTALGGEIGRTPSLIDVVRTLYTKGKDVASKLFQRSFFDVAQTPKFMHELGLRGDKFTIKYGVIARHLGKDSSHTLTERDWEQLPQSLQNPFAISKLTDKEDSYRIYTTLLTESGEFVVVGADVKNAGREIEVNAVSTVFGRRNNANLPKNEEVIYKSNEITPEQLSLLERPNFAQYPTEQELSSKDVPSASKDNVGLSDMQEKVEESLPPLDKKIQRRINAAQTREKNRLSSPKEWSEMTKAKTKYNSYPAIMDVLNSTEPSNGNEYAAMWLASNKITPESFRAETGYGLNEQKSFVGMIASAENGGVSIEHAAELLAQDDEYNYFGGDDYNARNALIHVLGEVSNRGDLLHYIDNRRIAEADRMYERELEDEREYLNEITMRDYDMSVDDYEADRVLWNDYMDEVIEERLSGWENFRDSKAYFDLFDIFALESKTEEDGREDTRNVLDGREKGIRDDIGNESAGVRESGSSLQGRGIGARTAIAEGNGLRDSGGGPERGGTFEPSNPVESSVSSGNVAFESGGEESRLSDKIASAESDVDTSPTEAQKKAGNYKKGHVQIGSFNVTIEQPKGSVRSGVDKDGKKWSTTMQNTYGYIRGTEGVDGDHIDVFLSDDIDGWDGRKVFVVDQYNPDGSFDEHKVMLGFNDIDVADAAYLSNYEEGWSDSHKIVIRPSTLEDFEKWINSSHRKTKPFSEYSSVEENRRKPLRERVAEWANKLGIDIVVLENLDEVTNSQAREAIESGDGRYPGWYGEKSGKVYIYLPHVTDVKDIDETVVHEVVAHKGLRRLMGEKFDALCDMVWDSMSKENREKFMSYPGVNGNHRAAADEYMAYIAEKTELTEEERGIWDKIVQFVKDLITLNLGVKLSDAQIAGLIRASYAEMKREAGEQKEAEATDTTTHDTKNTSRERHDELLMIATEARKAMGERQAAYFPQLPKQRDLLAAYEKNDSKGITTWKKQFEDVLSKMVPLDIPMVESTIDSVLYVRDAQKHNKDSALYKAYNDIAKMLRKQKSKLESQLTDSDRDVLNAIAYSRGKGTRFSAKGYNPIAEKEVENIVVDTNGVSYSKDVALNKIPIGGLVKTNIDTGKNIKVSRKSLRHSALHDLKAVYAAFDRIEDIVVNAVKIGEIPVANDEIGKTNSVSIFYIPINIDGVQYSARLVVKELINKDEVLDDLSLYNMAMHKEKTPSNTNVGTSNDGLVYSDSVISVYKVKDLIHNTQEIDKKILNLDEETRFRRAKDSKSLVAVHNLSENNLRKVLEAGGLIMPSIAITDVNMGHSGYGEISLLFDKDTINPSDRRNKVYGGDAWTPRFPQMVPKLNGEVLKSIRNKIYGLLDEKLQSFYSLSAELHPTNMEPAIADRGIDSFYGKEWMKIAYLLDNGKKFKVPMKMKDYGTMAEPIIKLAKDRGLSLSDIHNEGYEFYKNNPDFVEAVQELKIEQRLSSVAEEEREKVRELLKQRPTGFNAFDTYISQALSMENDLNNGGLKQVIDRMALYDAINKKVKTDNADYNKWVDNLFDGVVEKYGIRNNRDWYTPSGNSRPWEQLYDPATPANILRHMLADNEQGGSGGLWDSNIMGASAETYESIDVIREKGKKRLHKVSADEYDAWTNSVSDRFAEICDEFMTDAQKNDFGGIIDAKITITNAVAKDKTAKGIYKIMSKEYPKFTMEHAKRVEEIVKEIQDYATTYFEAKPQRIVELSEVRKAIVPSDVSSDILEGLEKNGIDVATYRKGNKQSRARLIKKESEGLRFRVANRNQVGFVSNAMKAVEGIKQEKATPQQWLAMIEKQGGLKAGEDKWLGLSDWLKSSDKKTLTKDEVLEFIGENMIRIEEVKYVEQPEVLYFDDYEVYNEWQELGGDKKAFNELAEKYGDDFTIAFSYDETFGIVNVDDAEAAMLFGGYDKGTIGNPINSTRLDYTTEGLDNKREIALTVPTIESWNEYDDIHFGDAGGGRAVAWIRFGEATTYENVDDVQQVTDFHEPYKDVNGLDIYKPIGSFRNGDFIAHGKGRNGDMIYVVYINGNQVPVSYKTLDDARVGMNEYYNAHPRKLRKPLKVLVIDEIQSKRHQEGREKGYKNVYGDQLREINKQLVDVEAKISIGDATPEVIARRESLLDERRSILASVNPEANKIEDEIRAKESRSKELLREMGQNEENELVEVEKLRILQDGVRRVDEYDNLENEINSIRERIENRKSEYKRLLREIDELDITYDRLFSESVSELSSGIPSAPFEKNWHELAMKRMLRLAAEEGFDKVAWTTGAQQAERYNIGTMVRDIEVLPVTDAETGEVLDAEFDVYTHSNSGNYISEATGRMNTEQIMEVFGKDLGGRIIEGGRTQSHTVISGKGLNIGGEGMKGFYDRMLPSFVNKYTKKWGTKVGEVELPELEESAQKMWSVDVTEQMKAEVEEQVMFSRKPVGGNSGYVGYSMSKRAETAREEGRYPKTDFKKEYGITDKTLDALVELGIVNNSEWHHTSSYGNRTTFYGWAEPWYAEYYAEHKAEIDKSVRALSKEPKMEDYPSTQEGMDAFSREMDVYRAWRRNLLQDVSDGFESGREAWEAEERAKKERMQTAWEARLAYNQFVDESLNVPEEYKAKNGVRVVTHGKNAPYEWEFYWGENPAFKRYANEAREELKSSLKKQQKSLLSFEEWKELKATNDRFNEELQMQIDGTLPVGHIYQLGMPGKILLSCGFPNMPIELSSTNLAEHARKTHHPFELKDVKGIVKAMHEPIAVFSYGDKEKSQNVIVEIQKDGRNFLVGVHFNQARRNVTVSDIRGIFPKDNAEWLNWINQGKSLYLNKEKIQELIDKQRKNLAEVEYLDLDSIANVIESFENPNISEEKVLFRVDEDVPELMPGESVSDFLVRLKSWRRKNSENEFTKNQSPLRSLYEVIDEYESMLKSKDKEIRSLDERLRHYANRLSKTEKRNMALIKDRNTINDLRSEIERFIRKQISSDFVSYMRKSDLNNLLHQMHSTNNMDELENILLNVNTIVRRAEIRHTWNTLDRLLSLKVQGVNGRNMSIARNVDDSTRRIFSYIRGTVADLRLSGYEEEMTELRKKGKALTEDLKEAENELSDATDEATKNDIMTRIEQIKKKQDERKNRMKELETLSEEAKKAKGDDTVNNIESELSAMQAIYEEKTEKGTWTTEDNERLTALNLMQLISHNSRMSSAMTELEKGIDLDYNSIIHEKNPDKLESAWAALKGKKMEYANALNQQLIELSHTVKELRGLIEGGRKSLLARREAEAERRRNILLNGIQSVRGKHVNIMSNELRGRKGFFGVVDRVRNFITLPLASFEYMTQRISTTTGPSEDSWLYKYFVKGKDGVLAAYDTYKKGIRQAKDAMDAESENIFGKNKRFSDLMIESDKVIEKSGVYKLNNNDDPSRGYDEMIEVPLSKGQAMYIYMVWKMDDGRSKLTVQGFNENSIAAIRRFIGEKYVAYADWIQGTFLKDLRKKYNDKYLEIYDTSLAEIKNYVPLRIRKESVRQESDLSDDKQSHKTLEQRAGSLINRVVNVNPVDINMNGFAVIADHVNQMEEWNAYARVRKDLDYLLSNNYFRNQLNTNRPGSFERFYEAASVATASYRPDDSNYSDSIWKKLSKGVIGGNIAYRLNTALKQVLSFPAFAGYSTNLKYQAILMKRLGTIKGNVEWAYEHLPSFYERVASGSLGDEKLDANGLNKFLDKAIETGMLPNKWVDAIACSCGARSIYEFRFKQLTEDIQARNLPFIEKRRATEEAHRLALREADLYYNKTQQSSHPAYLSPMQLSGTFLNSMLTTYQNSNIGYVRMTVLSYVELKKTLKKDAWVKSRTDYYIENGYDNAEAHDKAVSDWWSHHSKYLIRVLLFGWVLNLLWNLGSNGLLGFMNGDDDEPTVDEMIGFAISSPIRGVPAGNIIEGSLSGYGYHPFLVFEELDEIVRESATAYKEHGLVSPELAYEILSTGSRVAGFDLEVWGNMYMGIEGMMRSSGDAEHMTMDLMFLLNVPKRSRSQIAKYLYKDKSPLEFATALMRARKYVPQNDLWEKWVPGTKYVDKRQTTKTLKEIDELKSGVPSTKSDKETELSPTQRYNSLVELQDIIEDHELQKKMGEYKAVVDGYEELDAGNDWRAAEDYYNRHVDVIDAYDEALEIRSEINSEKKNLGKGDDEAVMRKIRELRKELFEKL